MYLTHEYWCWIRNTPRGCAQSVKASSYNTAEYWCWIRNTPRGCAQSVKASSYNTAAIKYVNSAKQSWNDIWICVTRYKRGKRCRVIHVKAEVVHNLVAKRLCDIEDRGE